MSSTNDDARQIVVICGHGRSGTNYTLDILDCHELTNCRNEPDEISGSSVFSLEKLDPKNISFGTEDGARLTGILNRLRFTKGERDRFNHRHKAYLNGWLGRPLFDVLQSKRKIRLAIGLAFPEFSAGEWRIPRLMLASAAPEVFLVAKLNQAYQACSSLLEGNTGIRIIHVVRHPMDVLGSWERRWLQTQDRKKVETANRTRLHEVARSSPPWGRRFGNIDGMSVYESELLYWLYGNETLYTRHRSNPRYLVFSYEDMAKEPLSVARRLFGFLGLQAGCDCARRVSTLKNTLFEKIRTPSLVPEAELMKLVSSSPIMRVIDSDNRNPD